MAGFQALKELGIEIEVYCASEIDDQAMQVGTVIQVGRKRPAVNPSLPHPSPPPSPPACILRATMNSFNNKTLPDSSLYKRKLDH